MLISYWVDHSSEDRQIKGVYIRHTSHADAAFIASCQIGGLGDKQPSGSVWLVPGTEREG